MLALLQVFVVKSKGCKYAPAYAPLSVSVNSFFMRIGAEEREAGR